MFRCLVQLLTYSYTCWMTFIFGTPKNGSLQINSLPSNNSFSDRNVLQNGINALSKMGFKELGFLSKSSNFVHFGLYDLVQISPAWYSPNTYQIMYGETLDLQC